MRLSGIVSTCILKTSSDGDFDISFGEVVSVNHCLAVKKKKCLSYIDTEVLRFPDSLPTN